MAGLNISMPLIAAIAQEIISLYALWDRYSEDANANASARAAFMQRSSNAALAGGSKRTAGGSRTGRSSGTTLSQEDSSLSGVVTPMSLVQLLLEMREKRMEDLAHPASGRPVAVNKMLERTQAAG